jgi:hypothetical protein
MRTWPGVRDLVCLDWTTEYMVAHRPPMPGTTFSMCGAGPWRPVNQVMAYRAELAHAPLCPICWDTPSVQKGWNLDGRG